MGSEMCIRDRLKVLLEPPDRVLGRDTLVDLLNGYVRGPFARMDDVRVTRLRRKIEDDPARPVYLRTDWGEGYLVSPPGAATMARWPFVAYVRRVSPRGVVTDWSLPPASYAKAIVVPPSTSATTRTWSPTKPIIEMLPATVPLEFGPKRLIHWMTPAELYLTRKKLD